MIEFDIRTNIKQIERKLTNFAFKQVPFAQSQALNSLAKLTTVAEQANELKVLDRPKPFTTRAIRVNRANKARPYAVISMMDTTAKYLEPYQFGGDNVLNGKALLKPIGAVKDLDQFGNLPRKLLQQLKARADVFIGTVKTKAGPVNGVWQRAADASGMTSVTKVTRSGKVITRRVAGYVPSREGRNLKLLIKFEDAHPVNQNLDWFGVASRVINKNFNREFGKALAKAIATAKL